MNIFSADLFRSLSRNAISVVGGGLLLCRSGLEKRMAAVAIGALKCFANCYIAARKCLRFIGKKISARGSVFEDEMEKAIRQGNLILSPERVNNRRAQVANLQGVGSVTLLDGTIYNGPMSIIVNDSGEFTYFGGGRYTGEIRYNQPNGEGERTYSDGAYYKGYFKDGRPHGPGEMLNSDNTREIGKFKEGLLDDENGEIIYSNGNSYKGRVERSKPHGFGVLKFENGNVYIGIFKDGELEGQGKMQYGGGCVYNGAFKKGKRHGHGKLVDPNTAITYEGSFIEGIANGRGTISYSSDRSVYVGDVNRCRPDGWGKITFADGKTIEGEFSEGILDGSGTITFGDFIYRGIIKDQMANGRGTISCPDKKIKGTFAAGQPIGEVEVTYSDNGRVYQGEIQDGEPNGRGTMTYLNKTKHEGVFRNGKLNDPNGRIIYPNRSVYEGNVEDGLPNGRGTLDTREKNYQGAFEQGKIQGPGRIFFKKSGARHAGTFVDGKLHGEGLIVLPLPNEMQIQVKFEHGRLIKGSYRVKSSTQQNAEIEFKEDEQPLSLMEF